MTDTDGSMEPIFFEADRLDTLTSTGSWADVASAERLLVTGRNDDSSTPSR
jgi:hypothetical protein